MKIFKSRKQEIDELYQEINYIMENYNLTFEQAIKLLKVYELREYNLRH